MSQAQVSWIIRSRQGQIIGPLTTQEVLNRIADGTFIGDEMISAYPQGKWVALSKEPEFYDQLLAVLEKKADDAGYKKPEKKERKVDYEETIFMPPPPQSKMVKMDPAPHASQQSPEGEVIELEPKEDSEKKKKQKRKTIFAGSIAGVVILFGLLLLLPSRDSSNRIRLLRPQVGKREDSADQTKSKFAQAVLGIQTGSIDEMIKAQNHLVSLIEGQGGHLEARALLCYVYKELWPFSFQDADDKNTVKVLSQSTRALNLTSPYGQLCDTIRMLLVEGRYREARAQIDSLLETHGTFSLLPLGYFMKAEILELDREYSNAAPYYEKAGQMWTSWARPIFNLAQLKLRTKEYQAAYQILQQMRPQHSKSKERYVLLGLIEAKGFQRKDAALRNLDAALNQPGRLPMRLESEAWLTLAELWIGKNEKSKARQAAQRAYLIQPQNKQARDLFVRLGGQEDSGLKKPKEDAMVMLGDQYVRQGDCLSAQAEFKAAYEVNTKNAEAAMKAGICLWKLNQSFDAIEWLNKAIRSDPKLISAYVTQADYLSQRYDFVTSHQLLMRAQQQTGQNYEILRGFACLEYRKNNMISAIQFAERAKALFDGDVETYVLLSKAFRQRALAIYPDNPKLIKEREEAIKNMKSYATRAVELDSTSTDAQIVYAETLAAQHGVDTGVQYFNELIKKFFYTLEYRIGLANLLKSEERHLQALEIFEQVLVADPKNKQALMGLGQTQWALGRNEPALKTFLQAAIVDPSDAESFYYAGQVLVDMNRFEQALENYRKALKVNPNYPRVYLAMGRASFAKGDFAAAKTAALEERKRNPKLSDPMILLAEINFATKQFAECAQEYSNALKLRQSAELYVRAATCYRQSGSLEIAQDMLSLAKQRENGYADIYKEQGAVFQVKGDNEAAIESYQMYLELSPNAPDRSQIQEFIRSLGG